MKCPTSYTFALRIPFHLLQCWCYTSSNLSEMIWSTSYHHVTLLVHRSWHHLLFTITLVHRRQVFAQASPPRAVHRSKASDLPFTLAIGPSSQALSWSSPPWSLLTPVEAHRDKIRKRTGIEVVFTQSIIEYHIHGETCVCCLTSLSRDSNQGLRYE